MTASTPELTTEQLLAEIKRQTGREPAVIKHYPGRREGMFYRDERLWRASLGDTYLIADDGSVVINSPKPSTQR